MRHVTVQRRMGRSLLIVALAVALGCPADNGTQPGTLTVTVSFASCPVADRAVWLAYQDGNGAWTRVIGAGDVYTFGMTSGTGGVAYVVLGAQESRVQVQYMTRAELTAGTVDFCDDGPAPGTRTMTGTATNVGTSSATLSLGGATFTGLFVDNFAITGVSDGTHDLVGFLKSSSMPGLERGLLRRDIVVSGDGSVGTVDFTGPESFAAASATMTLVGLVGGEAVFQNVSYLVGATCRGAPLLANSGSGAETFTAYGIPAGLQRASDFHRLTIVVGGASGFRTMSESFHTFGARTITVGAALGVSTVTTLGGPYKRLQAVFTVPGEYSGGVSIFSYVDGTTNKTVSLRASAAYRGGLGITLALADFSALPGWDNNWAPAAAAAGEWFISGFGLGGGSACVENATQRSASRNGEF